MDNVKKFINNNIVDNTTLIVSCSGGPDSMCLLRLLIDARETKKFKLICAHVNHNVREESAEEEEFVRNYCNQNNVVFEILKIESYKGNFHNDARVLRYKFLKKLCDKYKTNIYLTAHHGDDLMETILMRISRGSNLSGYIGFKVINKLSTFKNYKPLIYVTKEEILKYNDVNNIEYRLDKTNESLEYTRNKFRHIVLPSLKKIDDKFHLKFLKFSEKLNEYDKFVKDYIIDKNIIINDKISVINYLIESDFIKKRSIELLISIIQESEEFYVTDNIIFEIEKLLLSDKGKATIDLPNNHIGIKENKQFYIHKKK